MLRPMLCTEYADGKMLAEIEDGIGTITINNPQKRNAINASMSKGIAEILDVFEADPSVVVAVLKGAGDKAFIAGADLGEVDANARSGMDVKAPTADGAARLARFGKPVIAQIQGYCIGGGMRFALLADFRIVSEEAQFGVPVARLGNAYSTETISMLVNTIGHANTRMMLYTAERVGGAEAVRWGLANRCVPAAELASTVRALAKTIAGNAPLSIKASKKIVEELVKAPADRDIAGMAAIAAIARDSKDFAEGRAAFLEKRQPVFRGI
jgi:enoyl-CoA hydratase